MPPISQIHHQHDQNPKRNPNPKILSFILKSIIMLLLISLFFIFLGIAAIAVLHILVHRRRLVSACRAKISPENISICLPEFRYTENSGFEECAICMEGYSEGDMYRRLPGCCHMYHSQCVDRWLVKVPNCPVCRTRVRLETSSRSSGLGYEESKVLRSV